MFSELKSKKCPELIKFNMSQILGEEVSWVVLRWDEEDLDLLLRYAFSHIMITNIYMFSANFLHRV